MERTLKELATLETELHSTQATLSSLSELIQTIPEKIINSRTIPDIALWNAQVNNTVPEDIELLYLKAEVVNPLYQSTRTSIVPGSG